MMVWVALLGQLFSFLPRFPREATKLRVPSAEVKS
jgi:hypothetical protein